MEDMDVAKYLKVFFNNKLYILVCTGLGFAAAVFYSLLATQYYTSVTTILPNIENKQFPAFAEFAAFAGIALNSEENPSLLYPEILRSRTILDKVIRHPYAVMGRRDTTMDLIYYWFEKEKDRYSGEELINKAIKKVRESVLVIDLDIKTSIMAIKVTTEEPELSAQIANRLTLELDDFNRNFRNIKAKEQRIFIEDRLREVKEELKRAEERLKYFREKNRRIVDSPMLLLEQERLIRDVELQNTIFVELKKQYEKTKIEEVKNTPMIDILDKASVPTERCRPKRRILVIFITCVSFVIGVGLVGLKEFYRNHKEYILAVINAK